MAFVSTARTTKQPPDCCLIALARQNLDLAGTRSVGVCLPADTDSRVGSAHNDNHNVGRSPVESSSLQGHVSGLVDSSTN
jgi:hypothetical protein